jgi:5-formyltetrahydrofolate cyclo-ligase
MNKTELRSFYKEKRSQLDEEQRAAISKSIAQNLENSFSFEGELISIFLPISRLHEIDTSFILEKFSLSNSFCSPVADFQNHSMEHIELNSKTVIKQNDWGIPEPSNGHAFIEKDITVVIVPLLISDLNGNRLGYGKGFYDRFLAKLDKDTSIIGINYFEPVQSLPEVNKFDIPLHYLATADTIFKSE